MKKKTNHFQPSQIILHIPHSSLYIPEKYTALFYLDKEELREELLRMTDSYTNELFELPEIPKENRIVFPYSRLICDVERFREDQMESMARKGMGVCYWASSSGKALKRLHLSTGRKCLRCMTVTMLC